MSNWRRVDDTCCAIAFAVASVMSAQLFNNKAWSPLFSWTKEITPRSVINWHLFKLNTFKFFNMALNSMKPASVRDRQLSKSSVSSLGSADPMIRRVSSEEMGEKRIAYCGYYCILRDRDASTRRVVPNDYQAHHSRSSCTVQRVLPSSPQEIHNNVAF